jgi:glycosyltransferase involved in cell wall biosynthesis
MYCRDMPPRLLITLDSMRHENTGLHAFGRSLGQELIRQGARDFDLAAYVHTKTAGRLGGEIAYVRRRKYHSWYFPRRSQYDIVHFADQYCRFGPERVQGRTVLTVHDLNQVHERPAGCPKRERHMANMARRIAGADRVVAISAFVRDDILRFFPQAREKISVIHNGADAGRVPEGHLPRHLPPGSFLFTVGLVCPKKNFHVLVPLLRGSDRTLVIAGPVQEGYRRRILAEAARFGVNGRVAITGPVSQADKDWYYAHCEAFLFPSLAEGFGLPVIEAMHHGRPVFLSRSTSLPEVGGDAACYFDHFDPDYMSEVLAGGLARFAGGDGDGRARAHAARFTWQRSAASYLDLYRECLAR